MQNLPEPLSWKEARSRLRKLLEEYVENPPPPRRARDEPSPSTGNESLLVKWIANDLDLYFGSLACSVGLLTLSAFSFLRKLGDKDDSALKPSASESVYRSQLAACILLVLGSFASLWMVRRRAYLSLNDTDSSQQREILRFLRALGKCEENERDNPSDGSESVQLSGTALNDIYPVYRRSCRNANKLQESWTRIPSLLLVDGDYIALQVGDIAPACCVMVIGDKLSSVKTSTGERITLELLGETSDQVLRNLPKGRSSLSSDSEHVLTLCNRKRIFWILDAPLKDFIYRPAVTSRTSQASRRMRAVRHALFVLGITLVVITSVALFSRSELADDLTLLLPIPLLAALGVLPIIGPAFVFFLEALGTTRILAAAHPYACSNPDENSKDIFHHAKLVVRYMTATCLSRLALWDLALAIHRFMGSVLPAYCISWEKSSRSRLIRVPPASLNLLEKLGVATAFTLIDDELACDPQAIPQQLLIPSDKGLKLLDLCPCYDDASDDGSIESSIRRRQGRSFDSDSESDDGSSIAPHGILRRKILRRRNIMRSTMHRSHDDGDTACMIEETLYEVQFEEPSWWQFLPSLKCIGLACLALDENRFDEERFKDVQNISKESSLARSVCHERRSKQLRSLAHCIGFSTHANANGQRGDVTPFCEHVRFHILSTNLFRERLILDAHERSSEESRWWGLLRPDATSVVVVDARSNAFELLTVGDPLVVIDLCQEAWQGESSTILPLGSLDRRTIMETTNNWKLGDLDVQAFSYSPVPRSLESMLASKAERQVYLLDHHQVRPTKEKVQSPEWTLMKNQIFLGVLGSLVVPRRETQNLLHTLSEAGVRFVYFSPRNMRRQKELASQMGIDVAWNCAISLRPLESGTEDPHRMVSNYADWDVNAKLPHGVEDVRKHLEEVDNVPLLVSLYTDVTKATTQEMVEIFQDYSDTVIAVGLSHLPQNDRIFSVADIAVGIDVLKDQLTIRQDRLNGNLSKDHVLLPELEFVSAIAARSCAFRFHGANSVSHVTTIIEQGRASLNAAVSASLFVLYGSLAYSFFVLFSVCVPSTNLPYIPVMGTVLFLQFLLPGLGFTMALSDGDDDCMKRVPPKNDQNVTFAQKEGWRFYINITLKVIPTALLPQIQHLICFGELMIHFEPELVETECDGAGNWLAIVRCDGLRNYSGPAKISAGILVLGQLALCVIISSAGFLSGLKSLVEEPPGKRNRAWVLASIISVGVIVVYITSALSVNAYEALPWYYYVLNILLPFFCLAWVESCKKSEIKSEQRADKLRRLQFETRLGAWSPK